MGKKLATANYDFLMPVTLNVTNVERLLVQVLERVVKAGKTSPAHAGNASELDIDALIRQLASNAKMGNFDSDQGRAILNGWLRSSVVHMIPVTKSKIGEQIDYLKLLTVASYKSGLPRWRSKHMKVDLLVYRSMLHAWMQNPGATPDSMRTALVGQTTLGNGLEFAAATYPYSNPEYSGKQDIDINALLELRFLEGIKGKDPKHVAAADESLAIQSPVPSATLPVGRAVISFTQAYKNWSAAEITTSLTCIIAYFMYQLPIRTGLAIRELIGNQAGTQVLEAEAETPLEMYFDFTDDPAGVSSSLSRACVSRDLQLLSNYFSDMVLLRETEASAKSTRELREELETLEPVQRLVRISNLISDPKVETAAGVRLEQIEAELAEIGSLSELDDLVKIRATSESNLAALIKLVLEDRQTIGLDAIRKWSSSMGGLTKDGIRREHALLAGTMKAPTTWRYSMSEPMLLTMINLCFLDERGTLPKNNALEMRYLLDRLERRFGILINKPPSDFDTPEGKLGASENFTAFVKKLKTLGYFEGLSDDFSAQFVVRPEVGN